LGLSLLAGSASALRVSPVARHATAASIAHRAPAVSLGLFDNVANAVKYMPLQQMIDQRIARISQILMKTGGPMTAEQAFAQFDEWKAEIGDDPEKFTEVARRVSEDDKKGEQFIATRLMQLPRQLDDVIFVRDPKPGVYGPIASKQGLHLIYLHFCGDPTKMGPMAIFDPPDSVKRKVADAIGGKDTSA